MTRLPRVFAALLLPVVLSACGAEKATETETGAGTGAPSSHELAARAGESALELVYVTEVPGFELAKQSVGVIGHDGFFAAYVSAGTGGQIQLSVDRKQPDRSGCPKPAEGSATAGGGACERDGDLWYRATGTTHEYARAHDGHVVRVGADAGLVDRATLRRAAENAHRADTGELDEVLPPSGRVSGDGAGADEMPERGDLPPVGDGAPRNDVGASG
ncbi:hypothetical protein [Streptomyces sp. NPDC054887]